MREIRSDEARQNLRDLLNDVEHQGEHVTILRYNTPAAVIVPVSWYERAAAMTRESAMNIPAGHVCTENCEPVPARPVAAHTCTENCDPAR